jgi:hypothetical protein
MKHPQFSLRELFLLVALAVMAIVWAYDHWSLNRYRRAWLERFNNVPPGEVLKSLLPSHV